MYGETGCRLVSYNVSPKQGSKNRFGPVAEGSWIRLRGRVIPMWSYQKLPDDEEVLAEIGDVRLDDKDKLRGADENMTLLLTGSGELVFVDDKKSGIIEYLAIFASAGSSSQAGSLLILERIADHWGYGVVYRRAGIAFFSGKTARQCFRGHVA